MFPHITKPQRGDCACNLSILNMKLLICSQIRDTGCFKKCEGENWKLPHQAAYFLLLLPELWCFLAFCLLELVSWLFSWLLLLVNTLCFSCPRPKIRCKMTPDTRFFLSLLFLHWLRLCQIFFYTVQRAVDFVGARHSCSLAGSILINPF